MFTLHLLSSFFDWRRVTWRNLFTDFLDLIILQYIPHRNFWIRLTELVFPIANICDLTSPGLGFLNCKMKVLLVIFQTSLWIRLECAYIVISTAACHQCYLCPHGKGIQICLWWLHGALETHLSTSGSTDTDQPRGKINCLRDALCHFQHDFTHRYPGSFLIKPSLVS